MGGTMRPRMIVLSIVSMAVCLTPMHSSFVIRNDLPSLRLPSSQSPSSWNMLLDSSSIPKTAATIRRRRGKLPAPLSRLITMAASGKGFSRTPSGKKKPPKPSAAVVINNEINNDGAIASSSSSALLNELTPERKENLYQCLLRDLQVEGVPLLSVDAESAAVMQAALWTTMAELLENSKATSTEDNDDDQGSNEEEVSSDSHKCCLIFESIPVPSLQAFVDEFMLGFKARPRLTDHLPEIQHLHLSLVGKGVGPAILMEYNTNTTTNNATTTVTNKQILQPTAGVEERNNCGNNDLDNCEEAMKRFMHRLQGMGISIRPSSNRGSRTRSSNNNNSNIIYRACGGDVMQSAGICHVASVFWNCICELQQKENIAKTSPTDGSGFDDADDQKERSIMLLLPQFDGGAVDDDHDNEIDSFAAVSEILGRSLSLYYKISRGLVGAGDDNRKGGNDNDNGISLIELAHFSPHYDRDRFEPKDEDSVLGHLPPTMWLRPLLVHHYYDHLKQDAINADGTEVSTTSSLDEDTKTGRDADAAAFADSVLAVSNFQRRSPVTAVWIAQQRQLTGNSKGVGGDGISVVHSDVGGDGIAVPAKSRDILLLYKDNAIRLAAEGKEALQTALDTETAILHQ